LLTPLVSSILSPKEFEIVRDLHKAAAVVLACCIATAGIFVAAFLKQKPKMTSAELLEATRMAVRDAVDTAVMAGGLNDSETFMRERISWRLASMGFEELGVKIVRRNDFDVLAAFDFDVVAADVSIRLNLAGVRDPLLAIRLGLDWVWREDPNHPYEIHGGSGVMSDCLTNHYFHLAADGPDFFARLENKTEDAYHHGVETFLVVDGQLAVDHLLLGGHQPMDDAHRIMYGLG